MNLPIDKAIKILTKVKQLGCEEVVLCPGGRNAPFVEVLSKTSLFKTTTLFEERSAGFYACGLIKKGQGPVAVITTSGTAVAELLPSVIEAYYQGLPLIIITADRPKNYRGSGAPQSIKQSKILSEFCQSTFDLEEDLTDLLEFKDSLQKPLHINICFDEPLLSIKKENYDGEFINIDKIKLTPKCTETTPDQLDFNKVKQPLVILGQLDADEASTVLPILKKLNLAIYAEAHSGLKYNNEISNQLITTGASTVGLIFKNEGFDSVIRIGGIPTLRFWRDLNNMECPVLNFSKNQFSGLSRIKEPALSIQSLKLLEEAELSSKEPAKFKSDSLMSKFYSLLEKYPNSEQSFVHKFSRTIENNSQVFLANSLPIREWDSFASPSGKVKIQTLRGANGIDGNISYFLGLAKDNITNYCLLGDLSALYDLAAGFLYKKYYQDKKIKIIIINNGGGKIFSPLFKNETFENSHDIEFSGWAKMFNLGYQKISSASDIKMSDDNEVIELIPDNSQSAKVIEEIKNLVREFGHE